MRLEEKTILMVDDDEEDRMLLKDVFEELGFTDTTQFEENGEKALAFLKSCNDKAIKLPCLIVLDLNMPRLNGRETLRKLKNTPAYKNITVVIYSTSLNPKERDECMALGAHDYMIKPISYKQAVEIARYFHSICQSMNSNAS